MLILAHRGYHAAFPENTFGAFEAAVNMGVSGIETDVRLSKDYAPVLVHDRVVGGYPVAELTRVELEQVMGHEVPTLDEALEHFRNVLWNIEVKAAVALPLVIRILEKHHETHRIVVTSFRHDLVGICASSLKVNCGLLVAHRPQTLDSLLADLNHSDNPRINHIVWDYEVMDENLLKETATNGFRNFVFGPVTKAEHDICRELGVDGVITDYPQLAQYG